MSVICKSFPHLNPVAPFGGIETDQDDSYDNNNSDKYDRPSRSIQTIRSRAKGGRIVNLAFTSAQLARKPLNQDDLFHIEGIDRDIPSFKISTDVTTRAIFTSPFMVTLEKKDCYKTVKTKKEAQKRKGGIDPRMNQNLFGNNDKSTVEKKSSSNVASETNRDDDDDDNDDEEGDRDDIKLRKKKKNKEANSVTKHSELEGGTPATIDDLTETIVMDEISEQVQLEYWQPALKAMHVNILKYGLSAVYMTPVEIEVSCYFKVPIEEASLSSAEEEDEDDNDDDDDDDDDEDVVFSKRSDIEDDVGDNDYDDDDGGNSRRRKRRKNLNGNYITSSESGLNHQANVFHGSRYNNDDRETKRISSELQAAYSKKGTSMNLTPNAYTLDVKDQMAATKPLFSKKRKRVSSGNNALSDKDDGRKLSDMIKSLGGDPGISGSIPNMPELFGVNISIDEEVSKKMKVPQTGEVVHPLYPASNSMTERLEYMKENVVGSMGAIGGGSKVVTNISTPESYIGNKKSTDVDRDNAEDSLLMQEGLQKQKTYARSPLSKKEEKLLMQHSTRMKEGRNPYGNPTVSPIVVPDRREVVNMVVKTPHYAHHNSASGSLSSSSSSSNSEYALGGEEMISSLSNDDDDIGSRVQNKNKKKKMSRENNGETLNFKMKKRIIKVKHDVPVVPSFELGTVETYNGITGQGFIWTWKGTDDAYDGQIEPYMLFVVSVPPSVTGRLTSQLSTMIPDYKEYLEAIKRFEMATEEARHPLFVVTKTESKQMNKATNYLEGSNYVPMMSGGMGGGGEGSMSVNMNNNSFYPAQSRWMDPNHPQGITPRGWLGDEGFGGTPAWSNGNLMDYQSRQFYESNPHVYMANMLNGRFAEVDGLNSDTISRQAQYQRQQMMDQKRDSLQRARGILSKDPNHANLEMKYNAEATVATEVLNRPMRHTPMGSFLFLDPGETVTELHTKTIPSEDTIEKPRKRLDAMASAVGGFPLGGIYEPDSKKSSDGAFNTKTVQTNASTASSYGLSLSNVMQSPIKDFVTDHQHEKKAFFSIVIKKLFAIAYSEAFKRKDKFWKTVLQNTFKDNPKIKLSDRHARGGGGVMNNLPTFESFFDITVTFPSVGDVGLAAALDLYKLGFYDESDVYNQMAVLGNGSIIPKNYVKIITENTKNKGKDHASIKERVTQGLREALEFEKKKGLKEPSANEGGGANKKKKVKAKTKASK